ncbi:MAG: C25 family cysteine peptidase [Kiritimatiellae bacterium]|nr:C25 family cysteine peptidase [Kiritimatiellia bacterium]
MSRHDHDWSNRPRPGEGRDKRGMKWAPSGLKGLPALLFAGLLGTTHGAGLSLEYTFARPQVTVAETARVTVGGCVAFHRVGEPELPFRTARIMLPPGMKVKGVTAAPLGEEQTIALQAPVSFGRTPIPIGIPDHPAVAKAALDKPSPATYGKDDPYPAGRAELVSVQRLNDCDVALVRLFPVRYRPLSATLAYAPRLRVTLALETAPLPLAPPQHRLDPARRERVKAFVDNPEILSEYESLPRTAPLGALATYDYLLVTAASLTNAFQPLVAQKIAEGLTVKVATIEEILAGWPGADNAAKLRSYIAAAYTNWNTTYVLLGGDTGTVPHRQAYAYVGEADATMPCDLYFACLDGSWNSDGDSYWGEPTDGEGGGDVDLLAEVYVGRAPVETVAEAERFVARTLRYSQTRHPNNERARFLGEYLGNYDGTHAQGGDGLDTLLPAFSGYNVEWLDDRPTNGETWTATDCVNALNAPPHLVAHFGHANETYALRMYTEDVDGLTNAEPFLVNSSGCYCGAFDYASSDCFAEELVKRTGSGAFAAIMNSRYGWFNSAQEWMFSGEFMSCFFDRLLTQGYRHIGAANQLAKHDMVGSVETSGDMVYRWCYFEITLFGDPHTALQTADDLTVAPWAGLASSGYVGGPFAPWRQVYTLNNTSASALEWTATHSQSWVSVSAACGSLSPGATTNVSVTIDTAAAAGFGAGIYGDTVVFSNRNSGYAFSRGISLTVTVPTGEITVEDSIVPNTDAVMPFAPLLAGQQRTGMVRVHNSSFEHDLVVTRIGLVNGYLEDFNDGIAQDWVPTNPEQWSVVDGEYRAVDPTIYDAMQSFYTGATWDDGAFGATMRRTTETGYTAGLFVRASADFVMGASGSAYGVGIDDYGNFWVIRFEGAVETWLTGGWVYSPYLLTGTDANAVVLDVQGSTLRVYFNGNLAWSGTDAAISGPGRIGLFGYTYDLDPTTHFFDDVAANPPLPLGAAASLSPMQTWYNAHPVRDGAGSWDKRTKTVAAYDGPALSLDGATLPLALDGEVFSTESLPALPTTLPPGGSFTFSVRFAPSTPGTFRGLLEIESDDEDEPLAEVYVSGQALMEWLDVLPAAPFVTAGTQGGPFAPAESVYVLTNRSVVAVPWALTLGAAWLTANVTNGTLAAGDSVAVSVSLTPEVYSFLPGSYQSDAVFCNLSSDVTFTRDVMLIVRMTLPEAIDQPGWSVTSGGGSEWFGQADVTHDASDAARSGAIGNSQTSWFETTVAGPGELSFWWKVSSESGWDFLEFYVNGTSMDEITGEIDWQQRSYSLTEGANTLRWRYTKDSMMKGGSDCGWVDQVVWAPAGGGDGSIAIESLDLVAGQWEVLVSATNTDAVSLLFRTNLLTGTDWAPATGQSVEASGNGLYLIRVPRPDTPAGFFRATGSASP